MPQEVEGRNAIPIKPHSWMKARAPSQAHGSALTTPSRAPHWSLKGRKYVVFPFCYIFQQFNELAVNSDEQQNQHIREDATALEKMKEKTPPSVDEKH